MPLLVGHLHHRSLAAQPGIIDQHIHPAQLAQGGVAQILHGCLICHIAHANQRSRTELLRDTISRFIQPPLMEIAQHHRGTFLGGALCGGKTDAGAGGGGHNNGLALEQATRFGIGGKAHDSSGKMRRAIASRCSSAFPNHDELERARLKYRWA